MRYITIPQPIKMVVRGDQNGPQGPIKPKEFGELLLEWLLNPDFLNGGAALRSARKIEILFDGKQPGDEVALEDADYDRLAVVAEKSTYNGPSRYLIPFLDAVAEAEKKPRAEREAVAAAAAAAEKTMAEKAAAEKAAAS